jgi:pimeloyl-ACP methyl ester carboxylesterase
MKDNTDNEQFIDFGGKGPTVHFSHANGFHPQSYRKLFDLLQADYRVVASLHRPIWNSMEKMENVSSWHIFAEDLISFLDSRIDEKVHGVGHSLGAVVTLLAAIKRPDLFKSVTLIEPVFMPRRILLLFNSLPLFLKKKVPIIKKALYRTDTWDSRFDAFEYHRSKRVFQGVDDDVLWDYINSGTKKNENDKFTLSYSKQWEVHCFLLLLNLWPLISQCNVPVLGIRGEHSDVLLPDAWQRWKKLTPTHQFIEVPGSSHLLPFEKPTEVRNLIRSSIIT